MASAKKGTVTVDGSEGEGGGQVLRTSLALSILTGRPFHLVNVRANRDRPGLRPQHLAAVQAAAQLCGAEVSGDKVGSSEVRFRPGPMVPGDLRFSIGTAGSTALLLHALHLPIAMRSDGPVRLDLRGGTFNDKAPSFPFLETTWRDYLALMGFPVSVALLRAGFYPVGDGRLDCWIEPGKPTAITLIDRPALSSIAGVAGIANLAGRGIAERMRDRMVERLGEHGLPADITMQDRPVGGPGAWASLTARHGPIGTTFVALGERGKPAEAVADEAVDALLDFESSPGAVDRHSADQLLLPLALADGRSIYTIASEDAHLVTNIGTIASFLDRPIRIDRPDDGPARVIVG